MKSVVMAVVALVVAGSSLTFAQDAPAKKVKMDDKHATMKSVSCDPACGFQVRGHDEAELIDIVRTHAKKMHNMDMSEADVRKMMKDEKEMKMEEKKEMKMEMKKEKKDGE